MSTATVDVDPSVSSSPLSVDGRDLPTVCVLCSHNCGLRVDVEGGRITDVRADERNPISEGYICNKGFSIGHYVDHEQRLQHPLRRAADGSFERIPWETAISEIGAQLAEIRERHSPRSIGLVSVGGQANHMDGPYALSFLGALGSKRWFNALAQEKHQHFLVDHWLFDAAPSVWFHPDVEHTRHLLVMGTNPRVSNRGHAANDTFRRIAEDPDCTMVVVDPRETETTRGADRHVRVRPGTDAWLLLGMAATIARGEGMMDAEFVRERTSQFEALREALAEVDVDSMARNCGLTTEELVQTARDYASAGSAAIMWDLAVEQTPFSTLVSYLIRVLATLTGNVGRPGGNLFIETAAPPTLSPVRFDEPERALASGIRSIAAVGGFPMFSPSLVPEEIMLDHPERLRALIVEGANPILSYSDASRWREARERLDLLVVVEPSMTETAALADYVLPTPCGYEKWEIAGFPKRFPEIHVQLRPPIVPGPAEALPEPEIYARLAEATGIVPPVPKVLEDLAGEAFTPESAARWFLAAQQEAAGNEAFMLFWGYRTLGRQLPAPSLVAVWVQCLGNAIGRRESVLRTLGPDFASQGPFELAAELFRRILEHPEGVEVARAADPSRNLEENLAWEDGRVRLAPELMISEIARAAGSEPEHDPELPFVLSCGLRTQWTANTIQRNPAWRKGRGPHCALHLSPGDADKLGVAKGDPVRIVTRRGSAELPAAVDKRLRDGHVWIPNGFGARYPSGPGGELEVQGVNLNELSDAADRDPISGCPHHKYTLCRIEVA